MQLYRSFNNTVTNRDPAFAKDPNAILQFFMSKVRSNVEKDVNRYPVGRLMN